MITISRARTAHGRPDAEALPATGVGLTRRSRQWAAGIGRGMSRRGVQVAIGMLWLVDGALQLQPFMFSSQFSAKVLLAAGHDQPGWVSTVVDVFAHQIGAHPVAWNAGFATTELALGVGLLVPRLVRPAIIASGLWAIAVWWLGEGFGGLPGGHATLITGAPGAAVLYAILAAAAWPTSHHRGNVQSGSDRPVAAWFPFAWLVIWFGGAWLQLLPGQNRPSDLSAEISNGVSGWLAHVEDVAAHAVIHGGAPLFVIVVSLMAAVGITGLRPGRIRTVSAVAGAGLAFILWMVGEGFGGLDSGHATDPNSGPVLIVMALALLGSSHLGVVPTRQTRSFAAAQKIMSTFPLRALFGTSTGALVDRVRVHVAQPTASGCSVSDRDGNGRSAYGNQVEPHPHAMQRQCTSPCGRGHTDGHKVNGRHWQLELLAVLTVLVTVGAAARSATAPPEASMPQGTSTSRALSMSPGMSMPASSQPADVPSVSARMVCGPEIRRDVTMVLALPTPPAARTTWTNNLYTCAYQLPTGRLLLSVKDAYDHASAVAYFASLSQHLGTTSTLTGMSALGLPAFEAAGGVVVFLKDDKTLEVDASDLRGQVIPDHQTPSDLAYTVATDVLGCWTGGLPAQPPLGDLKERGLRPPLQGLTDGAPGLIEPFSQVFDVSLRHHRLLHQARTLQVLRTPHGNTARPEGSRCGESHPAVTVHFDLDTFARPDCPPRRLQAEPERAHRGLRLTP